MDACIIVFSTEQYCQYISINTLLILPLSKFTTTLSIHSSGTNTLSMHPSTQEWQKYIFNTYTLSTVYLCQCELLTV